MVKECVADKDFWGKRYQEDYGRKIACMGVIVEAEKSDRM